MSADEAADEMSADEFANIVGKFMSTDKDVKQQGEASYNTIPADKKMCFLLVLVRNQQAQDDLRSQCTDLLRRLLTAHLEFAWNALNVEMQALVKTENISLLSRDEDFAVREKLVEVSAELARNLIDDDGNKWFNFSEFLLTLTNHQSVVLRENALVVFGLLPGIFGNQQAKYMDQIKQMLAHSFTSDAYSVRFHVAKAFACFITLQEKEESVLQLFSSLVPAYMKVMEESVREEKDDSLLNMAIEIVRLSPKSMRQHLGSFLQLCLVIAKDESVDDGWRHLAVECAISAAESSPYAVEKVGSELLPHYVQLMLQMMTDLKDEPEWATSGEYVLRDSESNSDIAASNLYSFANALGGKTMLPIVMAQVQTMLQKPDWKMRYAGVTAVSAVWEGCPKQMKPTLPQIVELMVGFLKDPQPQVRYAACNAIQLMATDFAPNFKKKFHSKIRPELISLWEDNSCPRVQACARAALANFGEEVWCRRIEWKNIMESCLVCLQFEPKNLGNLERLVSVAKTLEDDFVPFYERVMHWMFYIMQNANDQELKLLRGKTLECVSLLGLAVGGGEKFIKDAAGIMDLLVDRQTVDSVCVGCGQTAEVDNGGFELADDDPQLSYMITAWAKICEILGERFAKYLPMVMAHVLRIASIKLELAMFESDGVEDMEGAEDRELKLENKIMACQTLVCYARVMKNHFRPYVHKVVELVIPLLEFDLDEGVRSSCAEIVPHLLRCVDDNPNDKVALWNMLKNALLIAAEAELDSDVKCDQLFAIASCIELLPREALDQETINQITNVVEKVFLEHFDRSAERAQERKNEDYHEVIEQQFWDKMAGDNYVLTKAAYVLNSLLKVYGANYLPFMEAKIFSLVAKLISPDRYWRERQWALFIWDDVMEFTGPASAKYKNQFIPLLLQYLGDQSPEVRQAASYGCGVMAQYGQDAFVVACKEALPGLVRIVNDAVSRRESNIMATENAISAVAKIIKFCPYAVSMDEVIPLWISWLPIWEDEDEMDSVYGLLCDLVESNNPIVLGPNGSNLPRIVHIIAETFYRKSLADDSNSRPRIANIIRTLQMSNPAVLQQCTAVLNHELLAALQAGVGPKFVSGKNEGVLAILKKKIKSLFWNLSGT